MKQQVIIRYALPVCLLLSVLICFMPVIRLWGYEISIFDFIGLSSELENLLGEYADYTGFLQQQISGYKVFCAVLMLLPLCEAVALLFLKEEKGLLAAGLSILVNNTMAFIIYSRISGVLDYFNTSMLGTLLDMSLAVETLPVALWVAVYLVMAGVIIWSVAGKYLQAEKERKEREDFSDMKDIIMEQFHFKKKESDGANHQEYPAKGVEIIEQNTNREFYGGIIGQAGVYREKAFMMENGETVTLGSAEHDDVFIVGTMEKSSLCEIFYDTAEKKYHVKPLKKSAVYLKNGQPLGKDRDYGLPRGKELIIDSRKNIFKLA